MASSRISTRQGASERALVIADPHCLGRANLRYSACRGHRELAATVAMLVTLMTAALWSEIRCWNQRWRIDEAEEPTTSASDLGGVGGLVPRKEGLDVERSNEAALDELREPPLY